MSEGLMNQAGAANQIAQVPFKRVVITVITNGGFLVNYSGKEYYCKSVPQISKLLKEIFPDE